MAERKIDMMNTRFYTKEQVHQIVEQVLLSMNVTFAPERVQEHLDNDIPQKASPEDAKVALTVQEAAKMIGISKPSMYEIVRAGKVRTVKIGKKILISRQSLLDWIRKGDSNGKEAC